MKNEKEIKLLLDGSPTSFYWWGVIIADGSIDKNYNIALTCDIKDVDQIERFANYVNKQVTFKKGVGYYTNKEKITCLVNIASKPLLKPFKEEVLNWVGKKTYNPIKLDYFNTENLIYFLIGLIDGDGCLYMTKDWYKKPLFRNCRIVLHENWLPFLEDLQQKLLEKYDISSKVSKNTRGNAVMYFKDSECEKLLEYAPKVPALKRKWDKLVKTTTLAEIRERLNKQ